MLRPVRVTFFRPDASLTCVHVAPAVWSKGAYEGQQIFRASSAHLFWMFQASELSVQGTVKTCQNAMERLLKPTITLVVTSLLNCESPHGPFLRQGNHPPSKEKRRPKLLLHARSTNPQPSASPASPAACQTALNTSSPALQNPTGLCALRQWDEMALEVACMRKRESVSTVGSDEIRVRLSAGALDPKPYVNPKPETLTLNRKP